MIWKAIFVMLLGIGALVQSQSLKDCRYTEFEMREIYIMCISNCTDYNVLIDEMDEASAAEDYIVLFNKYCPKLPQLTDCLYKALSARASCIDVPDLNFYINFFNVRDEIIEFLCYNNGDRVETFIAARGWSCIDEKSRGIAGCMFNRTNETINIQEPCKHLDEIHGCVVNSLEECPTNAAVKMVGSLYPYAKKAFNCMN